MVKYLFSIIFMASGISGVIAQDQWKNVYTESAWTSRDQWQHPEELIRQLSIQQGSSVADIGCHEGYMTFKLSRAVGGDGKVYAVDLDAIKLEKLKINRDKQHISNITVIKGEVDNPGLPAQLDAALILDAYHEMHEHNKILEYIRNSLKAGGRLVICEGIAEPRRKSPRSDQEAMHEVGMDFVKKDLEKMGFRILNTKDPFVDRTKEKGDKMWLIVASRGRL